MAEGSQRVSIGQLILWPSVITLAITALRLYGELQHWDPRFFSREAGGGGALVGISWLPFIFGIYFALKLSSAGEVPVSKGKPILLPVIGIVIMVVGFWASTLISKTPTASSMLIAIVACLVALVIQRGGWPALFKVLLAYAFAARIPVALIMLFAIRGDWGTHYDVPPPNFPAMSWFMKWVLIGALPQFVLWIVYTVVIGGLVAGITAAIARRKASTQQPAAA